MSYAHVVAISALLSAAKTLIWPAVRVSFAELFRAPPTVERHAARNKSKRLHAYQGLHIDAQLDLAEHIVAYMVHEFGSKYTEALADRFVDGPHGSQPRGSQASNAPMPPRPSCRPDGRVRLFALREGPSQETAMGVLERLHQKCVGATSYQPQENSVNSSPALVRATDKRWGCDACGFTRLALNQVFSFQWWRAQLQENPWPWLCFVAVFR